MVVPVRPLRCVVDPLLTPRPPPSTHMHFFFVKPVCVRAQNKTGAAPQQSKKEESKKNKRARYAADNQKTVLERQQVRVHHGLSVERMTIYLAMPLGLLVHWCVVLLRLNSPGKSQEQSQSNEPPVSAINRRYGTHSPLAIGQVRGIGS